MKNLVGEGKKFYGRSKEGSGEGSKVGRSSTIVVSSRLGEEKRNLHWPDTREFVIAPCTMLLNDSSDLNIDIGPSNGLPSFEEIEILSPNLNW